jgi:hypothetical protein
MKIGLLCGREYSFPPAFLDRVNQLGRPHGISADYVKLTGTRMGDDSGYRVIVDRISHEVEYYRAFLKHAVLEARTSSTIRSGGRPMTSSSTTRSRGSLVSPFPGRSSFRRSRIRLNTI